MQHFPITPINVLLTCDHLVNFPTDIPLQLHPKGIKQKSVIL